MLGKPHITCPICLEFVEMDYDIMKKHLIVHNLNMLDLDKKDVEKIFKIRFK